jgi:hypothetical protein
VVGYEIKCTKENKLQAVMAIKARNEEDVAENEKNPRANSREESTAPPW